MLCPHWLQVGLNQRRSPVWQFTLMAGGTCFGGKSARLPVYGCLYLWNRVLVAVTAPSGLPTPATEAGYFRPKGSEVP